MAEKVSSIRDACIKAEKSSREPGPSPTDTRKTLKQCLHWCFFFSYTLFWLVIHFFCINYFCTIMIFLTASLTINGKPGYVSCGKVLLLKCIFPGRFCWITTFYIWKIYATASWGLSKLFDLHIVISGHVCSSNIAATSGLPFIIKELHHTS